MLDHVPRGVPPIIKYLGAQNVSSDAPDRLIALLGEPLVADMLGVKVMHLERAMMNMTGLVGAHEESMMIDMVRATVNVSEDGNILLVTPIRLLQIEEVGRNKVEGPGVKAHLILEVLYAQPVVSQLLTGQQTTHTIRPGKNRPCGRQLGLVGIFENFEVSASRVQSSRRVFQVPRLAQRASAHTSSSLESLPGPSA